jgi:methyltransferase (TIGR00027 family)
MKEHVPSATARRVAMRRAAHQVFDDPLVFEDPFALRILGEETAAQIRAGRQGEEAITSRALRAFMAVRSRFAEDALRRAVGRGVEQYVVLGAGLDTFAYRNPFADRLRVFEVDYPATQAWKRDLLDRAGIAVPTSLTFVPIDFERQTLADCLANVGVRVDAPAFFSWLGVTMYLSEQTAMDVFRFVATFPAGSGITFDYAVSPSLLRPMERMVLGVFSRRVAAAGEPWTLFFDPTALVADLRKIGFVDIEDLGPQETNNRYFSGRSDGLKVGSLARLMRAER